MALNKTQLEVVNQTNFPNNNGQLITPALLREFNTDVIASLQLQDTAATTGSNTFVGNQIVSGNVDITGTLTAYEIHTIIESSSIIYSSGSNQLGDALSDTQILSGSVYIVGSGSLNGNRILTTADTASLTFNTSSLVTTASFNEYTQSTNLRLNSLETTSQSLNQFTASQIVSNSYFATTGSNTFNGNQSIAKEYHLNTNGIYWNDSTAGYNNLEIINSAYGNVDISAINGRVRVINSPLFLTGSAITSSNDISTSANIYAANLLTSAITASSLITASVSQSTITFTKGNGTQFSITIADVSGSSGNFVTTASFNAYTQSTNDFTASISTSVGLLQTFSGSQYKTDSSSFDSRILAITASVPAGTVSSSAQIVAYNIFATTASVTASINTLSSSIYQTDATQSYQITANALTASNSTTALSQSLYFTDTTQSVNITQASASAWGAFQSASAYSASAYQVDVSQSQQIAAAFATASAYSASLAASITGSTENVNTLSASIYQTDSTQSNAITNNSSSIGLLQTFSGSQYKNDSSSFDSRIIAATGSAIYTGSFATTGSNTFIGNQTINGDISSSGNLIVNTITASAAQITYLHTIYESSSVIYSSGSNQLGDELTDTQILSGSVQVVGGLTLNGVSVSTQSVDISALNAFTASQYVSNSYFATTSSVNTLSASIYQTDATQSNNISNNSSSIGLLQTFSGSQYKNDSSSFDSRIIAATGSTINTGSFATTGSNSFLGTQTLLETGSWGGVLLNVQSGSIKFNGQVADTGWEGTGSIFLSPVNLPHGSTKVVFQTEYQSGSTSPNGWDYILGIGRQGDTYSKTVDLGTDVTFDVSRANLVGFPFTTTASFNLFSGSQYKTDSASFDSRISSGAITGSSIITASVSQSTITFTKGDNSTFNITIADVSGSTFDTGSLVTTASFNAYTSSQDFKNTTFATTSSVTALSQSLYFTDTTQSNNIASNSSSIGLLQTFSGSQYKNDSSSFDSRINAFATSSVPAGTVSSSAQILNYGIFATTGSNTFTGTQTIKNSLVIENPSNPLVYTQIDQNSVNGLFQFYQAGGNGYQFNNNVQINGEITASGNISSSGNIYAANLTGSTIDTGSLVTTASFNAYTQSTNDFTASISTSVGLLQTFSSSQYKGDSSSFDSRINGLAVSGNILVVQEEGTILGPATSMNFIGSGVTATISAGTASVTITGGGGSIDTGSFATTGSNTFTGNQTIEGAIVSNPTTAVTKLFSQAFVSGATQLNITASNATSQSNLVLGGTPLDSTSNGSVIISGSGNILHNPSKGLAGANAFTRGYVGGNNNYLTVIPTLHTQSLFNPAMTNNIGTGTLTLNFITSSLAIPSFSNNNFSSTITLNHQSGTMTMTNNNSIGAIQSTQNGLTSGTVAATITGNIIGGSFILNHTSSSIVTNNNAVLGVTTVNNNYYHTGSANNLTFSSNLTAGQGITINAGGSPSTNVARPIVGNLLGGQNITISAQATGSDLAGLRNEIIYGYNLIVSGAQSTAGTTQQGGAFFGRFNDINAGLADSGKTIFAVGTGTSTSNRKTALSVDSASVVNVSGSLSVTGSSTFSGSMAVSGTINTITISSAGDVTASRFLATSNAGGIPGAFAYSTPSSGSVQNTFNTALGKDFLDIYQYQGQPYTFNLHLTSDQLNIYSGSQFAFQLQSNGGGSLFGGATYYALASGSYTSSVGAGSEIPGLSVMGNNNGGFEINDFKAPSIFERPVFVQGGIFISGSGSPKWNGALSIDQASSGYALKATGSVIITGSLSVNGQTGFASLDSNTFTNTQTVSGSIYIAPNNNNNQLYLPSGSNKQTGLATLDGGNPGTVTVSNSNVTANSIIMLTKQTNNHPNSGPVNVSSKGSGTFTITSNHNGDTDVVAFMIINPS